MGLVGLLIHILNFAAPAIALAVALPVTARLLGLRARWPARWRNQIGLHAIVGLGVLVGGLWIFGHDGKMATYVALFVAAATLQWAMAGGWHSSR